jgi:CheY-like chemotaxis protein
MPHSARILLADDDMEDRLIIEDAFREIALEKEIAFVEDGELVIQYLNRIDGQAELPSLIVLDLNMPKLSGTETLRMLKNHPRYRHIPVKIFSTSMNDIEKAHCLQLGAEAYVIKPIKFEQCIDIARRFYDFCCSKAMAV